MKFLLSTALTATLFLQSHASTILVSPDRYAVTEGVSFSIGNSGASHFLFSWNDPSSGSFTNEQDPSLILTAGETYTFERISSAHPFIIMDSSYTSITGSDGSYARTSFSGAEMDAATLTPIADFTSSPGGGDPITWTPGNDEIGEYWYTCRVTGHPGMTGRITVIPEPSSALLGMLGFFTLTRRRR